MNQPDWGSDDEGDDKDESENADTKKYEVTWKFVPPYGWDMVNSPDEYVLKYLRGHLKRLVDLKKADDDDDDDGASSSFDVRLANLESDHERYTILQYYDSLVIAIKHAIWSIEDIQDDLRIKKEESLENAALFQQETTNAMSKKQKQKAVQSGDRNWQTLTIMGECLF